ncbi:hypothetical protein ACIBKY_25115 [Nonomuraea sp. NPDC050394]|uniref:hypothetical protein n=1 Tax=Nonomuraea sp. NPDC050394 TaxID=3364363 RepID=UPI00378ED51C
MILSVLLFLVAPGFFVGLLCGSVFLASEAARREHLRSRFLLSRVAGRAPEPGRGGRCCEQAAARP